MTAGSGSGVPDHAAATDKVLVLSEAPSDISAFSGLFSAKGFAVDHRTMPVDEVDLRPYGAIVHLARSTDALNCLLGDQADGIRNEEWILVAADGNEEDLHCTVQLTPSASVALRNLVRSLWAMFSTP